MSHPLSPGKRLVEIKANVLLQDGSPSPYLVLCFFWVFFFLGFFFLLGKLALFYLSLYYVAKTLV